MSTGIVNPEVKGPKINRLGLSQTEYRGAPSTLCAGCGHDSITAQIVKAFWESGIEPTNVAKMSGIGCSSKTTAYFLGQSHGFNGVHGRMAPTATGAHLANRRLVLLGVSGDGDTSAIGLGNFLHMLRRNVPMVYLIENNGVYALTKGQFSATADKGTISKSGLVNQMEPIDCCALAITMGATYVARTFSGDVEQVCALIKGAIAHQGVALIDIISPCMTFGNREGSTKSLAYAKAHKDPLHEINFFAPGEQVPETFAPGETNRIDLPDGSRMILKRVDKDYDPTDKLKAMALLDKARTERLFLTGLIYHGEGSAAIAEQLDMIEEPLATLPESMVRPGPAALKRIMEEWK